MHAIFQVLHFPRYFVFCHFLVLQIYNVLPLKENTVGYFISVTPGLLAWQVIVYR